MDKRLYSLLLSMVKGKINDQHLNIHYKNYHYAPPRKQLGY